MEAKEPSILIELKEHQIALVDKCRNLESDVYKLNENEQLITKMGVIGDKVGSGKSYVILALCTKPLRATHTKSYSTYAHNFITKVKQENTNYVNTNIIVIPHNIFTQWKSYIQNTTLKTLYINKTKTINSLSIEDCKTNDLIVVTNTMYNHFVSKCNIFDISFNRIFYDEADNIKISACQKLNGAFYWFVTASIDNLKYPGSLNVYNASLRRYVCIANGIKALGFIKDLYTSLSKHHSILHSIVMKNDDSFVDSSLNLPHPITNTVRCKTPYYINVLDRNIDNNIMRCLNAEDIRGALQYLNSNQKDSEENIISLIIAKYRTSIYNLEVRMKYVDNVIFDSEAEKQRIIENVRKEKADIENKIANIKERIKNTSQCPICYDEIVNKTVINCCQNAFCFTCLSKCLQTLKCCPMCKSREYGQPQSLYVVDDSREQQASCSKDTTTNAHTNAHTHTPVILKNKLDNAIDIILKRHDKQDNTTIIHETKRILVLSQFDSILVALEREFMKYQIPFGYLKGRQSCVDSLLEKYENGDISVLLINPNYYGSGMNLQNTTDIIMFHKFNAEMEKQVVGRAQRLGRSEPVNLWYLLHENEIEAA